MKLLLSFCISTAFVLALNTDSLQAQSFVAVDDEETTGPRQMVIVNVMMNDLVPCATDMVEILTSLNPSIGKAVAVKGGCIEFTPGPDSRESDVAIVYGVRCGSTRVTATLTVHVSKYNNPANLTPPDITCFEEMKQSVAFAPSLKYVASSSDLDGFSMPLVGDLNGDGKPEIVALGLSSGGTALNETDILGGLGAEAGYIVIYNGQTGSELAKWSLPSSFKLRYEPRHNSVSKLAMADVDNDGLVEIFVTYTNGYIYCLKPIYDASGLPSSYRIVWSKTTAADGFKSPVVGTGPINFGSPIPYIADINADGTPELIIYNKIYNARTGNLDCTLETLNEFTFTTSDITNVSGASSIHRKYAFVGRRPGAFWNESDIPCMAIVDINGDGFLDIVAGSKVYLMKDDMGKPALDKIIYGPQTITAQRGTGSATTTTRVNDGFTAVADIDGNDTLDVIVMAPAESSIGGDSELILYVWEPMKAPGNDINTPVDAKAATYLYVRTGTGAISTPFVGDVNGRKDDITGTKRLPEICYTTGVFQTNNLLCSKIAPHPLSTDFTLDSKGFINNAGFNNSPSPAVQGHIVAFTYHGDSSTPIHQRLKLSWAMEHQDQSGCTGITMFDFDNDGANELCYRDEITLRVISPAGKDPISNQQKHYLANSYISDPKNIGASIIRFRQPGVRSYTAYEPPLVIDANRDGSADIVSLGLDKTFDVNNTSRAHHSRGYVYVFQHAPGTAKWAPAPSVWNQAYYSPLLINEDMTVPAKPQSMLTKYYSPFTGDSIQPYNGHWIQHAIVKAGNDFRPIIRKPNAMISDMKVAVKQNLSTEITLVIANSGEASISANAHITFYDGGATGAGNPIGGGASIITAMPVGIDVFPNRKEKMTYALAGDYTGRLIWARIMDNMGDFVETGETECDSTNNLRGAADCPTFKYTVATERKTLCGFGDSIRLAARRDHATSFNAPSFQWYYNEIEIAGANDSAYFAKITGEYKCFVIDGICRTFASPDTIKLYNPKAIDRYATIPQHHSLSIDLLAHEPLASTCRPKLNITAQPSEGTAKLNATGDSLIYTSPSTPYIGLDSLTYSITANGYTEEAKLYILILRAGADRYIACAGASANLSMTPIPELAFYWFSSDYDTTPVAGGSNSNNITVIKNSNQSEQWSIEARWKNKTFPRYRLELHASNNCGDTSLPAGCASEGSIIERHDFGGRNHNLPRVSNLPLADAITSYSFTNSDQNLFAGQYCLVKQSQAGGNTWHQNFGDRSTPSDAQQGYFFMAKLPANPVVLYQRELKKLCNTSKMHLSLWVSNPVKDGTASTPLPALNIELIDGNNYTRVRFTSNEIPRKASHEWLCYGFTFEAPDDCDSLTLRISNAAASSGGHGLTIDDVELRICTPSIGVKINGKLSDTICSGQSITLSSDTYIDDGSLLLSSSDVLTGHWTQSLNSELNRPSDWTKIAGSEISSTPGNHTLPASAYHHIPSMNDTIYYRFVITSTASASAYCSWAASDILPLDVKASITLSPDIRIQMCAIPHRSIYLSSYLDTINIKTILWSKVSNGSPDFVTAGIDRGELLTKDFALGTHIYKYEVASQCQSSNAYGTVYIKNTDRPTLPSPIRDTVSICNTIPSAEYIQVNQILGLETFGDLDYPSELTPFVRKAASPSRFDGAYIFDARAAWLALKSDPRFNITFRNDPNSAAFVFTYTGKSSSCLGLSKRELVLVVTK
ncbi:MAG: VCBS repeat-containing protein [Prevotellaceae bacterium]|jgi:hypothetical protein|nr:VCBS repeat-containing protein [Prevotellaceae bacterium]